MPKSIFLFVFLLLSTLGEIQCRDFRVRDGTELRNALYQIQPGDEINLIRDSGMPKLELRGSFEITRNGTESAPIHFNGHPNVTFVPDRQANAIVLKASYWVLKDLLISCEEQFSTGLKISGLYNKILHGEIKECEIGILLQASSENLVENCDIISSKGISLIIDMSWRNTVQNNRVRINHRRSMFLNIGSIWKSYGQNIIRDNVFEIEESYTGRSPFEIEYDPMGQFDGNRVFDYSSMEINYLFFIQASNYTVTNNIIFTKKSTPFKLYRNALEVKFKGNEMGFREILDPEPYCILGDPGIHANNTEIADDNKCINGKLTNIFGN